MMCPGTTQATNGVPKAFLSSKVLNGRSKDEISIMAWHKGCDMLIGL